MFKSAFCLLLSLLMSIPVLPSAQPVSFSASALSAQSAILIESDTETVLVEKDAHKRMGMASTTKIMTAVIVLENSSLGDMVSVHRDAINVEGSSIYLTAGEMLTVEDLLYALLLESANDAAMALAFHIAGNVNAFAEMMNQKASELGLSDTNFVNPHGLYDEHHYTTAYDLAIIMSYAMQNEDFAKITATKKFSSISLNKEIKRFFTNHNKLLSTYNGVCGGKTGFTKKTGRTLVSCAQRDGMKLIAVTLNAPNDWSDHTKMFDFAFSEYETVLLAPKNKFSYSVPVVNSTVSEINCTNLDNFTYFREKNSKDITCELFLRNFYYAPIYKGDQIGCITFFEDGEKIALVPIYAENDAPLIPQSDFWSKIFNFFKKLFS